MKVKELIKEYEEVKKLKKEYNFKQHITRFYMPYGEKCALVKSIVKETSYKDTPEGKVYARDTACMLFVFTVQLIKQYTNIELDSEDKVKDYDLLMESGVMNGIMEQIPAEEHAILSGMIDMERDDLEFNTRGIVPFLETKKFAIMNLLEGFEKALNMPEIQSKIAELHK